MKMVLTALAFAGAATSAQAENACPSGNVAVVRISSIKPTGSMAGFREAATEHAKWYKSHGYKDEFTIAPLLIYDQATNSLKAVPNKVMTIHARSSQVPSDKQDAGWAAYVAKYQANSEIETTTLVCLER
ncbi:MAG: hypothetical protein RQ833_02640 [Sphingomonadaceae bacterium]|nr:hypothetical protein [Sphingomonadaceae bacterium]